MSIGRLLKMLRPQTSPFSTLTFIISCQYSNVNTFEDIKTLLHSSKHCDSTENTNPQLKNSKR